ncbi:MAG TPA: DUF445 domain-containing protein [Ideonella sp.]|nr:DUF445 domain-containing protein [Ideonella sp.]
MSDQPPQDGAYARRPDPPQLARMKALALGLLGAAALLYIVAMLLLPMHPGWGYAAAFAEAAMVGAIADWFAVVALFRHPLGLPIPHTAIIPSNKDRIGEKLAGFICNNFLSTPQVLAKLHAFDPAAKLAAWLSEPAHAEKVGEHLVAAARYGLGVLDDERVRLFVSRLATAGLQRIDAAHLAGQLLALLTTDRKHQALLDRVLLHVAELLADKEVQATMTEAIAGEIRALRYIGLDQVAARLATGKVINAVANTLGEMADEPEHPLRLRFDGLMNEFVAKLQGDTDWQAKGEALKQKLLAHPALNDAVHKLWDQTLAWLHEDLALPESSVRRRITASALHLGEKLRGDPTLQAWINAQITEAAPRWIERYREDIRLYIVARVADWNAEQMTDELERNIGRDLQFIRINGTLVGGLVGLTIHTLTVWLH